jgi:hypothetical protein
MRFVTRHNSDPPSPRPGDDHEWPIAALDDPLLVRREPRIADGRGNHEMSLGEGARWS